MFFWGVGVIIIMVFLLLRGCQDKNYRIDEINSMYTAANSQILRYKTKTGLDSIRKMVLLGDVYTLKSMNAAGNKEIERLQRMVNKNTISATVIGTTTSGTASGNTTVSVPPGSSASDTAITPALLALIKKMSCSLKLDTACFPTYTLLGDTSDKWISLTGFANSKGFKLNYHVFNDYEITQEFKKEGKWYNRVNVPYITVTNLNPHTITTKIQSFAVAPAPKDRVIIGLGSTYGYDLFTIKPALTVGITVNYRLFGF